MSSRFVSGGTITTSGEKAPSSEQRGAQPEQRPQGSHNAEWEAVQKDLETERKRREEVRKKAADGEEKSLYEVLQANKAAKEAAFQEANRLRNQFRALDDDEIDFLDEVRNKQKMAEAERKRQLEEGVKAFKEAQKGTASTKLTGAREDTGGQDNAGQENVQDAGESWSVGRKRKRKEKDGPGLVRKKTEPAEATVAAKRAKEKDGGKGDEEGSVRSQPSREGEQKEREPAVVEKKGVLGLVDYGSDSDDG